VKNAYKVFDGSEPDTSSFTYFQKAYRGLNSYKFGWTQWLCLGIGSGVGGTIANVGVGNTISLDYRNNGTGDYGLYDAIPNLRDYIFQDKELERPRRYRPTSANIFFQRPGAGEPTLTVKDYRTVFADGETIIPAVAFAAASGTDTPILSTGGEFQGPEIPGAFNFGFTGNMYVFGLSATTYPVGPVLNSPYGFLTNNRLCGYAFFRPPTAQPQFDQDDSYWQPGIWAHFQWHWFKGLRNYSYNAEAQNHAEKFIATWNGVFQAQGDVFEYLTPSGNGRGSAKYAWSGAALVLTMDEI